MCHANNRDMKPPRMAPSARTHICTEVSQNRSKTWTRKATLYLSLQANRTMRDTWENIGQWTKILCHEHTSWRHEIDLGKQRRQRAANRKWNWATKGTRHPYVHTSRNRDKHESVIGKVRNRKWRRWRLGHVAKNKDEYPGITGITSKHTRPNYVKATIRIRGSRRRRRPEVEQ